VLDVGCSDGYFLDRLQQLCGIDDGVGVDLSSVAVESARQLTKTRSGLIFQTGSAEKLPFADQSYTKIIVNEVVEHVSDDERLWSELSRVAKPGALIYITSPNAYKDMLPIFRGHCRKVDRIEGHLRRYSTEEFRSIAEQHGFQVLELLYDGFIASWLWYALVVYNMPLKRLAMRLVASDAPTIGSPIKGRPSFNVLATIPFALMRLMRIIDAPFSGSRHAMGMHALLRRIG